jgi:hypothetical protein
MFDKNNIQCPHCGNAIHFSSCPTGKRKYIKKEAMHQVNHARKEGRIIRAYRCQCNYWHLTHKRLIK